MAGVTPEVLRPGQVVAPQTHGRWIWAIARMRARYSRLESQLAAAVVRELAQLGSASGRLAGVEWVAVDLPSRPVLRRLAIVAADAGNVQLRLAPLRVSFVRVATSDAEEPLGELLFESARSGRDLGRVLLDEVPELVRPLLDAGVDPGGVLERAERRPESATTVRELLEWGALLVAVGTPREAPVLVVRDGLLRSIHLDAHEFGRLHTALAGAARRTGNQLVAVAKRVPGGADLVNALLLAGVLDRAPPTPLAFLRISEAVERAVFPPAYASGRRMGPLLLARLRATGSFVPMEVLDGDEATLLSATASLFGSDEGWYPEPGYPLEVAMAHERAKVSALDREWLRRAFLDALRARDPRLATLALAAEVLGRGGVSADGEEAG